MRVLVFGGTGFVGSNLILHLLEVGHIVGNVSRRKYEHKDVLNFEFNDIESIIDNFLPEKIIYLSACFDNDDIDSILDVNIKFPLKILKKLEQKPIAEFIYIGSYWQFGDASNPNIPIDLYSASKKAIVSFLDYYNCYTKIECKEIVIYGTYGESDSRSKVLNYLLKAAKNEQEVNLTKGQQKLNLVSVDRLSKEIIKLLNKDNKLKYIIKSENDYTLINLVEKINSIKKMVVNLGTIPYRKVELMNPVVDESYEIIYIEDRVYNYIKENLNK